MILLVSTDQESNLKIGLTDRYLRQLDNLVVGMIGASPPFDHESFDLTTIFKDAF